MLCRRRPDPHGLMPMLGGWGIEPEFRSQLMPPPCSSRFDYASWDRTVGIRSTEDTHGRYGKPAFDTNVELVRRRYKRLAPVYPFFEIVFLLPPGIRQRAVDRLSLTPGDTVLELGCGTGRNLRYLVRAVGSEGKVFGVDCCEAMLTRARKHCEESGWTNVVLFNQDAAQLELQVMVDGALFSLSYSIMPNPESAVAAAWKYLRPGKNLIIMDGKLANGIWGRLSRPFVTWLSKRTILGDPLRLPWHALRGLTANVEIEEFNLGTYYICRATKNGGTDLTGGQEFSAEE